MSEEVPVGVDEQTRQGVVILGLASMPEGALLDEAALASVLSVTRRTVRRMVCRFELPPPIRLANRSTWRAGTILTWIERRIALSCAAWASTMPRLRAPLSAW